MDRSAFRYQAYFCEENIWHFARQYLKINSNASSPDEPSAGDLRYFVLFFINESRQVSLMNQSVFGDDGIGVWDYHVVFFDASKQLIFDFDTMLPFPVDARTYIRGTFPETHFPSPAQIQSLSIEAARIRTVPADDYIAHFSSDRAHMLDENGLALESFPQWDAIRSNDLPVDLKSYWNVDQQIVAGDVLDVAEFSEQFLTQ